MNDDKRIEALEESIQNISALLSQLVGAKAPAQQAEPVAVEATAPQTQLAEAEAKNLALAKEGEAPTKRNTVPLLEGVKLLSFINNLAEQGLVKFDPERGLIQVPKKPLTTISGSTAKARRNRQLLTEQGFGGLFKSNGKKSMSTSFYLALAKAEARGLTMVADGNGGFKPEVCEPKAEAVQSKTAEPAGLDLSNLMA